MSGVIIGPNNTTISPSYTRCAQQGQQCNFTGKKSVAYTAANTSSPIYYRDLTNGTVCDTHIFGKDPSPGNKKACYIANIPPNITYLKGIPVGFSKCAQEDGTCIIPPEIAGTSDILYGANGAYVYANVLNNVPCNSTTFGDPSSGDHKACYYRKSVVPISPAPVAPAPISPAPRPPHRAPPTPSGPSNWTRIIIIIIAIIIFLILVSVGIYYATRKKTAIPTEVTL